MNVEIIERNGTKLRKHRFPAQYPPESGKTPKLAIISAYDCLCGIAEYTYFLVQSLKKFADVTVYELDQQVFRHPTRKSREESIDHLNMICDELDDYDAVNIQFEPGTLGYNAKIAFKRYTKIVDASPAISVTFHTFLEEVKEGLGFWKELKKLRLKAAFFGRSASKTRKYLTSYPVKYLKKASSKKSATFIVHTKREVERLARSFSVKRENIFDHPLSFLNDEIISNLSPSRMIEALDLPKGSKTVGVFGFISEYKGTDLAVEAMRYLPKDHHLLIAGSVHPNELKHLMSNTHPYLGGIIDKVIKPENKTDDSFTGIVKQVLKGFTQQEKSASEMPNDSSVEPSESVKTKFMDRIHFIGAQDREEFLQIMNDCDSVLLPYREVGQTSSGPISMAVELGKRVIASRTFAFSEFAKYHPQRLEQFDQNNFIELSQRVQSPQGLEQTKATIDWRTNVETYFNAHQFAPVVEQQWSQVSEIDSLDTISIYKNVA